MRRSWVILMACAIVLPATQSIYSMRMPDRRIAVPGSQSTQTPTSTTNQTGSVRGAVLKTRGAVPAAARSPIEHATLVNMAQQLKSLVPSHVPKSATTGNSMSVGAALANPARRLIDPQSLSAKRPGTQPPRDWKVRWNEANGTPVHITGLGPLSAVSRLSASATASEIALDLIAAHREVFRLDDPASEMLPTEVIEEADGKNHIQFAQYYKGIPVWAQSLVAHLDDRGRLYSLNARYCPTPQDLDLGTGRISAETAIGIATADVTKTTAILPLSKLTSKLSRYTGPEANQYIWIDPDSSAPHLVWHVQVRPNIKDWWYYFVDAHTGEILEKYNNTKFNGPTTGSGTDLLGQTRTLHVYDVSSDYYMIDASRPIWQVSQPNLLNDPKGALWTIDLRGEPSDGSLYHVFSGNNTWTDPVSVSAHYNVGKVFEYFYDTHGRNSIDNQNGTVVSVIHVADQDGSGMDNAFWNGWGMYYGDGQDAFAPLAKSLDVATHEMAHGVTEHTVNLEYKFQSGALNESYSDVYGVLVDTNDWRMGEDVVNPAYFPSGALRNLADPHNGGAGPGSNGWQPATMSEYQNLTIDVDNGGVHRNSGIPNKAAYLIGAALGRQKLGQIYYRVEYARYLNSQSNFCDMRFAAIAAAAEIFGDPSAEVTAVKSAFDAVGILSSCGGQLPPDDPQTPVGDQWIAAANAEAFDNSLYLARPVIDNQAEDIVKLTSTQINTGSGKPMDVAYIDGDAVILFIDSDYNLIAIRPVPGNTEETVVGDQGVWWSVAASNDFGKVAITTVDPDSMIHILDLVNPAQSKSVRLYSPSTQPGVTSYITTHADVMDWDAAGEYILYDAYNVLPLGGGGFIDYWEINTLFVGDESIIRLFAQRPEGVSMGNPSFAQSSAVVFAFDIIDANECTANIAAADLYTGNTAIIEPNGCAPSGFPNLGFPHYSPDGSGMVIQWINSSNIKTVWQIPMNSNDLLQATGSAQSFLTEAQLPLWLATDFVSDVEHHDDGSVIPDAFALEQNFPNPFNASTVIRYETVNWGSSSLEIFNVLGQRVVRVDQQSVPPGRHTFHWDGRDEAGVALASGVYLYRVTADGNSQSRKMVMLR